MQDADSSKYGYNLDDHKMMMINRLGSGEYHLCSGDHRLCDDGDDDDDDDDVVVVVQHPLTARLPAARSLAG